jgi:hypothetical protein
MCPVADFGMSRVETMDSINRVSLVGCIYFIIIYSSALLPKIFFLSVPHVKFLSLTIFYTLLRQALLPH